MISSFNSSMLIDSISIHNTPFFLGCSRILSFYVIILKVIKSTSILSYLIFQINFVRYLQKKNRHFFIVSCKMPNKISIFYEILFFCTLLSYNHINMEKLNNKEKRNHYGVLRKTEKLLQQN